MILVTLDTTQQKTRRGPVPHIILETAYVNAIRQAGAIPICIEHCATEDISSLLDCVSGIVLTGGDFDIDPIHFDEAPHPKLGALKPERFTFEKALYLEARRRHMPILGICAGMQLMNVVEGGTLFQDIRSQFDTEVDHEQIQHKSQAAHEVQLVKDSDLSHLLDVDVLAVNSTHHQAIKDVAETCRINAISPDGLVEGLELKDGGFAIGVQWHPESLDDPDGQKIYDVFIDAVHAYNGRP